MKFLCFIGPIMWEAEKDIGFLAKKSENSPNSSAGLAVVGGLLTLAGVSPDSVHAVGRVLTDLGSMLQGF